MQVTALLVQTVLTRQKKGIDFGLTWIPHGSQQSTVPYRTSPSSLVGRCPMSALDIETTLSALARPRYPPSPGQHRAYHAPRRDTLGQYRASCIRLHAFELRFGTARYPYVSAGHRVAKAQTSWTRVGLEYGPGRLRDKVSVVGDKVSVVGDKVSVAGDKISVGG
eukprot:3026110-Rhodomonas_salina.1